MNRRHIAKRTKEKDENKRRIDANQETPPRCLGGTHLITTTIRILERQHTAKPHDISPPTDRLLPSPITIIVIMARARKAELPS